MHFINYDPLAGAFARYRSASVTDVLLGLSVVADALGPLDGKFVLDYGCGDGTFCRMLRNYGAWATGVDVSENMLELAQTNDAEGINYLLCDRTKVSLDDRSFDAVACNFVLAAFARRSEIVALLREAHRLLKPGGVLAVLTVNWELAQGKEFLTFHLDHHPKLASGKRVSGVLKGEPPLRVDEYYWSMANYRAMLRDAGFTIVETREPIATDDRHPWVSEKSTPPFMIFVAKKIT